MTRCKMRLQGRDLNGDGSYSLRFEAVIPAPGDSESENAKFFKYTPAGSLTLHCTNPVVGENLAVGNEYYVDIRPAPPS